MKSKSFLVRTKNITLFPSLKLLAGHYGLSVNGYIVSTLIKHIGSKENRALIETLPEVREIEEARI